MFKTNGFGFAGNAIQQPSTSTNLLLYRMPNGNLTDGIDPYTRNGAMSTATITKPADYDNIVVANTGNFYDSWFRPTSRIWSAHPLYVHMKVKIVALGAAPILGFRTLGPGNPYSNFTNQVRYMYINLLTGTITANSTSNMVVSQQNGFSGAVAENEVIDLYWTFIPQQGFYLSVVRDGIAGEYSTWSMELPTTALSIQNEFQDFIYVATIMHDGEYLLLDHSFSTGPYQDALVAFLGDSLIAGARQRNTDSIAYKLQKNISQTVANFSAATMYLAGAQSALRQILLAKPKVLIFNNALNALYQNDSDPADPSHATWSANMLNFVNLIIGAGIEPVLFMSTCTPLYPDARMDNFEAWWLANFPNRTYIRVNDGSYISFDGTGFHYSPSTNTYMAGRFQEALSQLGVL